MFVMSYEKLYLSGRVGDSCYFIKHHDILKTNGSSSERDVIARTFYEKVSKTSTFQVTKFDNVQEYDQCCNFISDIRESKKIPVIRFWYKDDEELIGKTYGELFEFPVAEVWLEDDICRILYRMKYDEFDHFMKDITPAIPISFPNGMQPTFFNHYIQKK